MSDNKTFVVSDESRNSYGLRVKTAGIKTERFIKNPVMLFMHDRKEVLGSWINLTVKDTQMLAEPVWDEADAHASRIKGQVDRGFIKAASIGIEPLKTFYNEADDTIEIIESILKEISIVSVPSNENALVVLYDKEGNIMNDEQLIALSDQVKIKFNLNMNKPNKVLLKALNLADTATESDMVDAATELAEKNVELADENKALAEANKKLKAENKTLKDGQKDVAKNMAINLVDSGIAAGKILPGEREEYIELAESNYDGTKKLLDKKKARVSLIDRAGTTLTEGADMTFAAETKGWNWDKFFKEGRASELLLKDEDRYIELYTSKFGKAPKIEK